MATSRTSKVIRWILYILITGVIIAFVVTRIIGTKKESPYETVKVAPADITQNVEVSGTTETKNRYKLQFLQTGQIDSIFVKEGEAVKAGSVLALLENGDAAIQLQSQKSALRMAQANLAKAMAGPRTEEINLNKIKVAAANVDFSNAANSEKNLLNLARKNVDLAALGLNHAENIYNQAKSSLDFSVRSRDSELNQAQVALDSAQIGVNQGREDLEYTVSSGYQTISQNQSSLIPRFQGLLQSYLDTLLDVDNVLGVNRTSALGNNVNVLGNGNASKIQDAKNQFLQTRETVRNYQNAIQTLGNQPAQYQTYDAFNKAQTIYGPLNNLILTTKDLLATTSTPDTTTAQQVNQLLQQIDGTYQGYQQNYQALLQNYQNLQTVEDKSNYSNISSTSAVQLKNNNQLNTGLQYQQTELAAQKKIDDANTALKQAQIGLDEAKANFNKAVIEYNRQADDLNANIQKADLNVQAAQEQLKLLKAPQRTVDIAPLKAQVDQAWDSVHLAEYRFDQTKLKAPADGIIADISSLAGENVNMAQPLMTLDSTGFYVKALISEADITKIKLENKVTITFDALGTDKIFEGSVKEIAPSETIVQGVIYYEIKIEFDPNGENIKSGMTSNLTIETASKPEVLTVPARAIQYEDNKAYVQILTKDAKGTETVEKREVKTGLESDQNIEIVSGVKEGEEVVTLTKGN